MELDLYLGLAAILGCRVILSSNLTTDGCEVRRLRPWIFSQFTAPAAPLRRLHSLSSASARGRPRTMIEVPSEFLNALFMLLIVFASVNRSKQHSAGGSGFGL
jgi:hypothetical protein